MLQRLLPDIQRQPGQGYIRSDSWLVYSWHGGVTQHSRSFFLNVQSTGLTSSCIFSGHEMRFPKEGPGLSWKPLLRGSPLWEWDFYLKWLEVLMVEAPMTWKIHLLFSCLQLQYKSHCLPISLKVQLLENWCNMKNWQINCPRNPNVWEPGILQTKWSARLAQKSRQWNLHIYPLAVW